jgi:ABC-type iron transport system FetAB ATPase subunit
MSLATPTGNKSSANEPALQLRGLTVVAGGRILLASIDLELVAGELVALSGPSGCGKTTLLRTITGLCDPAAGEIRLQGQCPGELKWPCYRRRTLLVDQRPILLAGTVQDNLARPFRYRIATRPFPQGEALQLLEQFGLAADVLMQQARSLSQGQQQRVSLVRALLLEPRVLLLDEPTSALDEEAATSVERLLQQESQRRQLAGLIVTHDRRQAERWCHRVFDLRPFMQGATGYPAPASPQKGS